MVVSFGRDIFRSLGDLVAGDTELWTDPNGRSLSQRVWLAGEETRRQIDKRLRLAIARGDDPIAVAKDLEQYLDPRLAPVRDEKTGRLLRYQRDGRGRILRDDQGRPVPAQPKGAITRTPRGGAGSAGARRLARTEISRAFNRAAIDAGELNPFVYGMRWRISGNHPESDACDEKARGSSRGFPPGVYRPSEFPQIPNHPQCRCLASPETVEDVAGVVRQLREDYGLAPRERPGLVVVQQARSLVSTLFRVAAELLGRAA